MEKKQKQYRAEFGHGNPWIFHGTAEDCRSIAEFQDTGERDKAIRALNAHEAQRAALRTALAYINGDPCKLTKTEVEAAIWEALQLARGDS